MTHQLWNGRTTHPAELVGEEPDEPETSIPVWVNAGRNPDECAVERSAHVDVDCLCRIWEGWRESPRLISMLHGFWMISGLKVWDAALREIEFLKDMLEAEKEH